MIFFTLTCLVILLIGSQHLLNWMWRAINNCPSDRDIDGLRLMGFYATLIVMALFVLGLRYLIIWGSEII